MPSDGARDGEGHSSHGDYVLEGFRYRTSKDVIFLLVVLKVRREDLD